MKYLIIRCEDRARLNPKSKALLEGARVLHLQHLAQAGSAGLIQAKSNLQSLDRLNLHGGFFGFDSASPRAHPGSWYAASADARLEHGETSWCCDFVTQHDGRILDTTAGHISTKESEALIQDLNRQLGSQTRRWVMGEGSHHCLITRDAESNIEGSFRMPSPELLTNKLWKRCFPKGNTSRAWQRFIEQSSRLLDAHAINRVRLDLGENPANMAWFWGGATEPSGKTFKEQSGLSGIVVSRAFPMRGFAQCLGLDWKISPASFEEDDLRRLTDQITVLFDKHDFIYLHLQIDSANPMERLCAMERLDQIVIKPITESLTQLGSYRLLVAIDDKKKSRVGFIAIGTGLPKHPIAHLDTEHLRESPLFFEDSARLYRYLTSAV